MQKADKADIHTCDMPIDGYNTELTATVTWSWPRLGPRCAAKRAARAMEGPHKRAVHNGPNNVNVLWNGL